MIGLMEKYHPRIQLRWQLARILVLNLLNLYTLIFSLFNRVLGMIKILEEIKRNITITSTEEQTVIFGVNNSVISQRPTLSSLSLIASQHLTFDTIDNDFQNCTFIIIQNCTIALLSQFRNGTTRVSEATESTEGYNASFPYYNATDDDYDGDGDMDSDYAAVVLRISNYTAHGVANWTVKNAHPPLFSPDGAAQFDPLYPDIWDLPINTSHLGFDDDNLTATVRTTMYDRDKNITTSAWLTPDDAATWILNNTETWNATEEPTTTTEQLNCTVRLCLRYTPTTPPDDNLTASATDYTITTHVDSTEESTVELNGTGDTDTTVVTDGTDSAPAMTLTPTVCCGSRCPQQPYTSPPPKREDIPSIEDLRNSPNEIRTNLKKNCWETMFGQELVKLTVSDVPMTIVMTLITDFIRAVFVRYANQCWCWDLEKGFPGYGDFKIAENILHLVNNQGMIWMGMFFAPGLPAINTVKLCILLYFRSWVVLTCNIPHETVFKASGSNNFYFALLLIMLFLCTLPVGFAVVWLDPSWHCGPFSQYRRIYGVFTTYLESVFPSWLNKVMEYVTSPGVVIPLLLLLVLIIYYLLSLTGSLRESNNDLKLQLRREKSSGKPNKDAEGKPEEKGEETQNDANKWSSAKKILPVLPNKFRVSGNIPGEDDNDEDDDDKQTDSRSRRVQYSGDDEQTEGPNGTDSPPTSENQATKNSTTQKSKRTPKPLLKSVENLRKEDSEDKRKSGRVTTGSIGSVDVPVITISQPSESKGKSKESLNSLEKKSPSPRHSKLSKKASEPVTLTPSRSKKGKKKRGMSLEDVHSESDVGNGSDARTERSTDDTETSDPEGSALNNHPAKDRRKRGEMTRYHCSRSHSSSLDTPPLIEEEEEDGRKSTLPIGSTKAKLQRQQADTDSLGSNQRPKSTTDAESTSDERKEPVKESDDKKAKIQRLSTDSL